jgi:hypothetical protein
MVPAKHNNNNTPALVSFREGINKIQEDLKSAIQAGTIVDRLPECTVKHYFTPQDDKFGCFTYAREMTIPTDTFIIGKIHRHQHLNIISKGSVSVITEHGPKKYVGPTTFVSEPGTKRAVYAEEGTIWTTIHTVSYGTEADLDKIEAEVIAPSYEDLNLLCDNKELTMLQYELFDNEPAGGVA